jgi:hypothetical protein
MTKPRRAKKTKPKLTPAEIALRRGASVAKRKNNAAAAKDPLLAWAGLTKTTTAEAEVARRQLFQEEAFWGTLEKREGEVVSWSTPADWLRWLVWSLTSADDFESARCWADNARGPEYCRTYAWRKAAAAASSGKSTRLPESFVHASACMPDLRVAIDERRWSEEIAKHKAAGCTKAFCEVSQRHQGPPISLGVLSPMDDQPLSVGGYHELDDVPLGF